MTDTREANELNADEEIRIKDKLQEKKSQKQERLKTFLNEKGIGLQRWLSG